MKIEQAFKKIMQEQTEIALATSVAEQPNVRIVNFFYDKSKKCVFFSTFKGNQKIKEFEQNPKISFTTIPKTTTEHIRVHHGTVKKSSLTIYDVAEQWIQKIPDYEENIRNVGAMLVLYELHFKEATVILDMENMETVSL